MAISNPSNLEEASRTPRLSGSQADIMQAEMSAVSWAAIWAGAATAAALSLILLLLGTGLGLSSISPWAHQGVSATAFGISTIVWLAVTHIIATGMGGYLTGRLRHRWADAQADEVYFRDTAHGFIVWAVSTIVTAVLMVTVIVNGSMRVATALTEGAATGIAAGGMHAAKTGDLGYVVDILFRKESNFISTTGTELAPDSALNPAASDPAHRAASTAEASRILGHAQEMKSLPAADMRYIGQLISRHTGLTQQEAEKRVHDTYASMQEKLQHAEVLAKEAADKARKASVYSTLWLFVSLLMGAFSASLAATWGGRCRDACAV